MKNFRSWLNTTYENQVETKYETPFSWKNAEVADWLDSRVLKAFPEVWQSAIKKVTIYSMGSDEVIESTDNCLFALSYPEYGGESTTLEGTPFTLYSSNNTRIKFTQIGEDWFSWYNRTRSAG
jgi:hypothetical protein